MQQRNQRSGRFVVDVPSGKRSSSGRKSSSGRSGKPPGRGPGQPSEWIVAGAMIGAAALAAFLALFVTSRPFDPDRATLAPDSTVPASSLAQQGSPTPTPSVRSTPTPAPTPNASPQEPGGQTAPPSPPDDASIQAEIEKKLFADPTLAKLDVSTIVESGKVTLAGSVKSPELKTRIERLVKTVKGVVEVDNQLVIIEATP